MSIQRRVGNRAPWILPVILALLIVLLIVAVIFGSKIKNAFSSATATPTPAKTAVVVTATPSGTAPTVPPTPGAGTAIPPTATPSAGKGASTPLPNATPLPTVVGIRTGMVTRPQHEVTTIQAGADKGDPAYKFYLDPRAVVQNTAPHYGFTQGFTIVSPNPAPTPTPHLGSDKRPIVNFIVSYQNKEYTIVVAQPGTQGPKGIWVIVTIYLGRQNP